MSTSASATLTLGVNGLSRTPGTAEGRANASSLSSGTDFAQWLTQAQSSGSASAARASTAARERALPLGTAHNEHSATGSPSAAASERQTATPSAPAPQPQSASSTHPSARAKMAARPAPPPAHGPAGPGSAPNGKDEARTARSTSDEPDVALDASDEAAEDRRDADAAAAAAAAMAAATPAGASADAAARAEARHSDLRSATSTEETETQRATGSTEAIGASARDARLGPAGDARARGDDASREALGDGAEDASATADKPERSSGLRGRSAHARMDTTARDTGSGQAPGAAEAGVAGAAADPRVGRGGTAVLADELRREAQTPEGVRGTAAASANAEAPSALSGADGRMAGPASGPNALLRAAPNDAPTGPTWTLQAPLGSEDFAPEMAARVSLATVDGVQSATLAITPPDMGPVQVNIDVQGPNAQVHFTAERAETRQALEQGLPQLAVALREHGLTLSGGGVSSQWSGGGSSNPPPTREPRPADMRSGSADGESGWTPLEAPRSAARPRGMVDLFA